MEQKEFHEVVSINEAKRLLYSNYTPTPTFEEVDLGEALGRVLFETVVAPIDVPPFDRAAMDGYAVRAKDTFYADEENPAELRILGYIQAGDSPKVVVEENTCVGIATGAPMPKGANAVVMVEYTDREKDIVKVYRPVAPGENIMSAGSDIMRGETVLRRDTVLSPRETGVLAALGLKKIKVYRRPQVGVLSTGNEIVEPGSKLEYGKIYDVNSRAIIDAVIENGGDAKFFGIVRDDPALLRRKLKEMLECDIIITSGGTSAGVGDLLYKVIDDLGSPGIIAHGIAVKPGKPTIIGVLNNKPLFGLPGYPTSAMVIFDVFVAPLIRRLAGLVERERKKIEAKTAMRLFSAKGRYEYMLVNLVKSSAGEYSAYPILTGSGAITTLAEADGYLEVPENTEIIPEDSLVKVSLLSDIIKPADLTIIGSHCIGVDLILNLLNKKTQIQAKVINVGSSGGLAAVKRGESDISGSHLIDEKTGEYNIPFLKKFGIESTAYVVRGYDREQGFVITKGNPKKITGIEDLARDDIFFINRNPGSGTRVLLDMELKKFASEKGLEFNALIKKIRGYEIEAKSHSAVAAAVAYGKADVGLAIKTVAEQYGLDFLPLREEKYDFVIPKAKINKVSVQKFIEILNSDEFKDVLRRIPGLKPNNKTGMIIHEPQ
jgi:putative molybdopterin biosynthesis protein